MYKLLLKKNSKKLAQLYVAKEEIENKYEILLRKAGCVSCGSYNSGTVDRFAERFSVCSNCKNLEKIREVSSKLDLIIEEIDDYIENEYALKVYECFVKKEPDLIRVRTGETITWKEAFGDDFYAISKGLRHSLVGLVEENLRYKLK